MLSIQTPSIWMVYGWYNRFVQGATTGRGGGARPALRVYEFIAKRSLEARASWAAMSQLGQKQTSENVWVMFALPKSGHC
jgi:hypothetical protein